MSIRIARETDLQEMLDIYAPYVTDSAISFEYSVPTLEEFSTRFFAITAQFPWLVWEEDGHVLGYAYGSAPFDRAAYSWCTEASIYLSPKIHGRGIGKKLYTALEVILKRQGYHKLYALIATENEASLAFHAAVGYSFRAFFPDCGYKLGRRHGMTWMEKQLNPVEIPSNFPVPAASIVNNDRNLAEILGKITLS